MIEYRTQCPDNDRMRACDQAVIKVKTETFANSLTQCCF